VKAINEVDETLSDEMSWTYSIIQVPMHYGAEKLILGWSSCIKVLRIFWIGCIKKLFSSEPEEQVNSFNFQ